LRWRVRCSSRALIALVRDVHEARRPEEIDALSVRAGRRIGSLTWAAFGYALGIVLGLIALIIPGLLAFRDGRSWQRRSCLRATSAFEAHVLSVIYYRITDPETRVIHPDVRSWQSVWEGV
jgi:hypothetical protein